MTTIADLSSDTWTILQGFLNGFAIVRLCIAGSKRLNAKLFANITELDFYWPQSTKFLGWPKFAQNFRRLLKFSYHSGRVTSSVEYFPTVQDLQLLAPTLQSLKLRCDGAEAAFSNLSSSLIDQGVVETSDDPLTGGSRKRTWKLVSEESLELNIKEQWPNLSLLSLYQFCPYMVTPTEMKAHHLASLPSTLHTLRMRSNSTLSDPDITSLPKNLQVLDLRNCHLGKDSFAILPSNLECLRCVIHENTLTEDFALLPRSIRRLFIFVDSSPVQQDFFDFFPPLWCLRYSAKGSSPPTPQSISKIKELRSLQIWGSEGIQHGCLDLLHHLCFIDLADRYMVRPNLLKQMVSLLGRHVAAHRTSQVVSNSYRDDERYLSQILDWILAVAPLEKENEWNKCTNTDLVAAIKWMIRRTLELSSVVGISLTDE